MPSVVLASIEVNLDTPPGLVVRGLHRVRTPPAALRGRIVIAAAAVGAFMAAGHSFTAGGAGRSITADVVLAAGNSAPNLGLGGAPVEAPQVLVVSKDKDLVAVDQLKKGGAFEATRAALADEAKRAKYVVPAVGRFTSGFEARWGTFHYGIDIANVIGTPVVAAADGTVIEAGPAHGFGQWVKVLHDDGTITVYGHVNEFVAHVGDRVKAGDEIATMGNKGASTGPHLHFEVWLNGTTKVDPRTWLAKQGIFVG